MEGKPWVFDAHCDTVYRCWAMGEELLPPRARRWLPWGAVLLAAAGSLALLAGAARVEEWSRQWVPLGNLILGLGVPAQLGPLAKRRRRTKGESLSCG